MAEIQGNLVNIEVDFTGVGDAFNDIICQTSGTVSMSRPINRTQTNCGSKVSIGVAEWTVSGDFVLDNAPGAGQKSFEDVLAAANNGTLVKVRVQHDGTGSDFYFMGDAYITGVELNWATEETVSFSATWEITGTVDTTP